MTTTSPALTFPCSLGGAVARGRKRLRQFLGFLLLLMIGVAISAFYFGRIGGGILALIAAIGPLIALGLVGETDLDVLQLSSGLLIIRLGSGTERIALAGAVPRRLEEEEIRHLERLAGHAGIVAGTGGYDSAQLGVFDLYASNLHNSILIETTIDDEEHRVVVTPDDPAAFLAALAQQNHYPASESRGKTSPP